MTATHAAPAWARHAADALELAGNLVRFGLLLVGATFALFGGLVWLWVAGSPTPSTDVAADLVSFLPRMLPFAAGGTMLVYAFVYALTGRSAFGPVLPDRWSAALARAVDSAWGAARRRVGRR